MAESTKTPNFNLAAFAAREQRRTERLVRAAYGVGQTRPTFRAKPRAEQEELVREWVDEAMESRDIRLGRMTPR